MDATEIKDLLLDRVRKVDPSEVFPDRIVRHIISRLSYEHSRECLSGSDELIRNLIDQSQEELRFHLMPQFETSDSYDGMHAPNLHIDQIGAFQSLNAGPSVIRYPPGSSTSHTKPCIFYSNGYCNRSVNCGYFHGSGVPEVHNLRQDHYPVPLIMLDMEISVLLYTLVTDRVPVAVEELPMLYRQKYLKPLLAEQYPAQSKRNDNDCCRLARLLTRLPTHRVVKSQDGQYYVVLHEDQRPGYLPPTGSICNSHPNQIYLTIHSESRLTDQDIGNYFECFGPVTNTRTYRQKEGIFGFVSFVYTETTKLVLNLGAHYFICGTRVFVKPYKEKHEGSNEIKLPDDLDLYKKETYQYDKQPDQ